jgi:NAD(P)-dependent dehydrogenase (short-subunit alcohol dehydrogenase family)
MRAKGGSLLVMSSVAGLEGTPGLGAYGAAKAGVLQLMKTLALEGARFGIRANAICPIWTDTPMVEAFVKTMGVGEQAGRERLVRDIPLGRLAAPSDVANACLYLASDEAAFLTGVTLPVDGGHSAGRTPSSA